MSDTNLGQELDWRVLDQRITELHNEFYLLKKERAIESEIQKERISELEKKVKILMEDYKCKKCDGTGWMVSQFSGQQLLCDCRI